MVRTQVRTSDRDLLEWHDCRTRQRGQGRKGTQRCVDTHLDCSGEPEMRAVERNECVDTGVERTRPWDDVSLKSEEKGRNC